MIIIIPVHIYNFLESFFSSVTVINEKVLSY